MRIRTHIACLVLLTGIPGIDAAEAAPGNNAVIKAKEASSRLLTGETGRAIQLYDEALNDKALPAERRANILNDRGVALWRANRIQDALTDFNEAAKLYPEYPAVYNNRGNLLASLNLPKEAIRDFNRAITLAPNYAAAFNNRANAHMQLGDEKAALIDFTKAIALTPNSPDAYNGRGQLQLKANRPYAALREFDRAEKLTGGMAALYRNRAVAYREVGRLDDAIKDLTAGIAATPENVPLILTRAEAYLEAKNYNAALKDYGLALQLEPANAEAFAGRGHVYVRIQTFDPAMDDLNRALEIDPRHARAYAWRALAHTYLGENVLALQDIERAIKLAPGNVHVQTIYAQTLEELGRDEEAARIHQAALALHPGRKVNAEALKRLTGSESVALKELPDAGLEEWRVFKSAKDRFFATNDKYSGLQVPLEVFAGQPRLLDWEIRKRPFRGIGVLRFAAGKVDVGKGPQEIEYAAIVDLWRKKVVSLEPLRQGDKTSTWNWGAGTLTIASVDGLKSEFVLRKIKRRPTVARAPQRPRNSGFGDGSWRNPWENSRPQRRSRPRRRVRERSLFDLFFR